MDMNLGPWATLGSSAAPGDSGRRGGLEGALVCNLAMEVLSLSMGTDGLVVLSRGGLRGSGGSSSGPSEPRSLFLRLENDFLDFILGISLGLSADILVVVFWCCSASLV